MPVFGGRIVCSRSVTVACLLAILTAGCAQVDVRRVTSENQTGIRYWRPAPYVALTPTTVGNVTTCEAKLVMLPDKSEEYAINMNSGLWGSASAKPTLQDGWNLTGLDASADSKTAEVLNAFAAVLKSAYPSGVKGILTDKTTKPREGKVVSRCDGLYRVEFNQYGQIARFTYVSMPIHYVFAPTTPASQKPSDKSK